MRFLRRLLGRPAALDHEALAAGDPWRRLALAPPLTAYGPGADHEFASYLQGPSRVPVATPLEAATWLLGCRYAEDAHLLGEPDHWLHPSTFEVVRSGDCEDYALWAWRKLVEARYDAEFVVGMHHRMDGHVGRHAWVLYRHDHDEFILDGVQRSVHAMLRPRQLATAEYIPQVGVSARAERFVFAGLFRSDWGRLLRLER